MNQPNTVGTRVLNKNYFHKNVFLKVFVFLTVLKKYIMFSYFYNFQISKLHTYIIYFLVQVVYSCAKIHVLDFVIGHLEYEFYVKIHIFSTEQYNSF